MEFSHPFPPASPDSPSADRVAPLVRFTCRIREAMSKPIVVIHFDINKTILMSDIASGRSIKETMNAILSECVWGVVDLASKPFEERTIEDWKMHPDQNPFHTFIPPPVNKEGEEFMTLGTFLEDHTAVPKSEQRTFKRNFTKKGFIGETFADSCEQLERHLTIDKEAMEGISSMLQKSDTHSAVATLLQGGYYHLLPSFFKLVESLNEKKQKGLLDFRILFRTYGHDISNVVAEHNLYCSGEHPLFSRSRVPLAAADDSIPSNYSYPPIPPSETLDMRWLAMRKEHQGKLVRVAVDEASVVLSSSIAGRALSDSIETDTCACYWSNISEREQWEQGVILQCKNNKNISGSGDIRGARAIQKVILGDWLGLPGFTDSDDLSPLNNKKDFSYVAAVQDDFHWWFNRGEADEQGKLFMVQREGQGQTEIVQVFFDDNIERDRAHIVDVRDAFTFEPVAFAEAVSKGMLRRVEPLMAIADDDYYGTYFCSLHT